ncbi:hypothetical protein [Streptomyces jumonjinensis]|uniref:hypothetical protein n=1 Tax=Streptomyces jumonjinensis TaxID=1945 RepID=UPI0037A5D487
MPFPRYKLEPGWIDVDVSGWELTGEHLIKLHERFHPDDPNADIEAAMDWAEGVIGSPQDWRHIREQGSDRWEAGTRD